MYYYDPDVPFPESREKLGCFADFVDDIGDTFCFKVVTADTEEVIYRSVLRSALDNGNQNLRPSNYPHSPDTPTEDDEINEFTRISNEESTDLSGLLNPSQNGTQPVPYSLLRDIAEIPLMLTTVDEANDPLIPSTSAHFMHPGKLI